MLLPRTLTRAIPTARSIRAPSAPAPALALGLLPHLRRTQQQHRTYSDSKSGEESKKGSDLPWIIPSVGLGAPAFWYVWQSGPEKKPHHGDEAHDHEHGKVHHQENTEEEEIGNQAEPAASPEAKGEPERAVQNLEKRNESEGQKPSDVDKPEAVKWAGGPSSMSGKQEGVDNANTSSPFTTRPGLSHKSEDDADTAKLKGTVDTQRKQV